MLDLNLVGLDFCSLAKGFAKQVFDVKRDGANTPHLLLMFAFVRNQWRIVDVPGLYQDQLLIDRRGISEEQQACGVDHLQAQFCALVPAPLPGSFAPGTKG